MPALHIHRHPAEAAAKRLLAECHLTSSDLEPRHFEHFFGCGDEDSPQGVVGLELHGPAALLRSLAVAEKARGKGCGRELVAKAERYAWSQGVKEIYLLTTTAEQFFSMLGYRRAERESAPEEIRATKEFSALCPSDSVFMVKRRGS
jgi:N-acetylglutamate synthase-like GNAT family acetyltransferase